MNGPVRQPSAEAPDVSVIIAAYNAARWLPDTLGTALAQRGVRLEVILADDGSTDETRAIVEAMDGPIVYLHLENSGGPALPRNLAIARARGRYVSILDADDRMRPGQLRHAVELLDAHPEAGVLFTDLALIDEHNRVLKPSFLAGYQRFRRSLVPTGDPRVGLLPPEVAFRELLHENFIGISGVMARRSLLTRTEGPFDPKFNTVEDFELMLRLAHEGATFLFLDEPYWEYRRWSGNLSRTTAHVLAVRELFRSLLPRLEGELRDSLERRIEGVTLACAWNLREQGEPGAALREYLGILRERPTLVALRGLLRSCAAILTRRRGVPF